MKGECLPSCCVCSSCCDETLFRVRGKNFCSEDCLIEEEGVEEGV